MKYNKGQALVEFIIILPIFLLLIISVIDFGNIISKKYSLENDIDTIYDLYKNEEYQNIDEYAKEKKLTVNYKKQDEFLKIELSKDINIMSPILNIIFGKDYKITVEKSIYE